MNGDSVSKVSLQFHACREELRNFLLDWAAENELHVTFESFVPNYSVILFSNDRIPEGEWLGVDRVALSHRKPNLSAANAFEFASTNRDALYVSLPRMGHTSMGEAVLAAMSPDPEVVKSWRALRRRLVRSMQRGAWVENVMTGARARMDSHPYTQCAKNRMESGMDLVGSGPNVRYIVD